MCARGQAGSSSSRTGSAAAYAHRADDRRLLRRSRARGSYRTAQSVAEVEPVQASATPPGVPAFGEIHGHVDVATQRLEPGGVEPAHGAGVAGDGPYGQVLVSTASRLLDH